MWEVDLSICLTGEGHHGLRTPRLIVQLNLFQVGGGSSGLAAYRETSHLPHDVHNIQRLHDGTIEVTDTLSKQDYYRSLRRPGPDLIGQNNGSNGGGAGGLSSQLSLDIGQPDSGGRTLTFGRKQSGSLEFKPSGREEQCQILMLEGVERTFSIDRNAYGKHLFDKVCKELDLRETQYFGITFRGAPRQDFWLKMDKRLTKQLEKKPWKLEFHVRYYPLDIEEFRDDLTRYFLCLQLRQDVISGQLPCSFQTYVILGAYAVQSEAGDFDPGTHRGVEYISSMPFAPQTLQTPQMLQRIMELHRLHKGYSPVQADRAFLENARRLASYGVEFHKAKTLANEAISVGVYHSGILFHRGRLRFCRFLWPQLIKLSHKARIVSLTVRSMSINQQVRRAFQLKDPSSSSSSSSSGFLSARRKAVNSNEEQLQQASTTLNIQCADSQLAQRLYESFTAQHSFFRLRESPRKQPANLTSTFNTRKYHYTERTLSNSSNLNSPSDWPSGRPQPNIHRIPTQRKPSTFAKTPLTTPMFDRKAPSGFAPVASSDDQYLIMPGSPAPLTADAVHTETWQNQLPAYRKPGPIRTPLAQEYWRMSPSDCTPGIGINVEGMEVAAMVDTGWQGCRTNRGVKWPGAYFYEATVLEEGPVRLGWSTNNANLILGSDSKGMAYGVTEIEAGRSHAAKNCGLLFHGNLAEEYGVHIVSGDVIGCFLELDSDEQLATIQWSHNGKMLGPAEPLTSSTFPFNEPIFPAAALADIRVAFNLGYETFRYPPRQPSNTGAPWTPVASVPDSHRVENRNVGLRVNPVDVTSPTNLVISPNGRMVQAVTNTGWHGFRVNKGVYGGGKYYYEAKVMEDSGLARIGWSFDGASLDLGYDAYGYGFGADRDGFGLNGTQGKKLHADVIDNYGEAFGIDDVIGCFLDLDNGVIQWSKNGRLFGSAYWLTQLQLEQNEPIFPAACLVDTTLELNYGDLPLACHEDPDWIPIFAAPDDNVAESSTWRNLQSVDRQEKHIVKQNIRMNIPKADREPSRDPEVGVPIPIELVSGKRDSDQLDSPPFDGIQDDEVHTFTDKEGDDDHLDNWDADDQQCAQLLRRDSYTRAMTERGEDEALDYAILKVTDLNPDTQVMLNPYKVVKQPNGHTA